MTAKEMQKRNEKTQQLRVIQVEEGSFYVESGDGKVPKLAGPSRG